MFKRRLSMAAALVALVAFAGCGGGGGGSSSGGSGTLGVYVTDAFDDQFSQVWVTLYKIELGNNGAGFQTVFDDPNGKLINVSALKNVASFLAHTSVPAAGFNQARVTIGDQVTLVPAGGGTGTVTPVDDSVGTHANGKVSIDFTANTTISPGQLGNLIVDFDLANFQLVSGKVRPHVRRGDDNAFQQHEKRAEIEGTVTNLALGGFDVQLRTGDTVHVIVGADTTIFNHHAGTAATLANGQKVQVKGSVDPATHTVTAATVRVEDRNNGGGDDDDDDTGAEAEGRVASVDATAKSFVLTLEEAEHMNAAGNITVVTNASTIFHKRHDAPASFADLAAGVKVEANGTFDPATKTLTATRVEFKQ